jgi:hypothetical protein
MKNEHKYMLKYFFSGITLQVYNLVRQDNQLQFICRPGMYPFALNIKYYTPARVPSHEIAGDQRTQAVRYIILLCLQFVSTMFNSYQAYIKSA